MRSIKRRIGKYLHDFYSIKRVERYGLYCAIVIGVTLLCLRVTYNHLDLSNEDDMIAFHNYVQSHKLISPTDDRDAQDISTLSMSPFDPNTISAASLYEMGLPPSAVKSMINFRNSGYQYKKPKDVLRCYGIDELLFEDIAPYIVISDKQPERDISYISSKESVMLPFAFDPNNVTRTELKSMQLPDRFINGFLNFRNKGAEFRTMADFDKLYVLTPEIRKTLLPYLLFPVQQPKVYKPRNKPARVIVNHRFRFDPNVVSRDSLRLLGVPAQAASTWVNFRNKGKQYRNMDDLRSIFGLTEAKLNDLAGLIIFPTSSYLSVPKASTKARPKQQSLSIDPNLAEKSDLMAINGIGQFYASQIVNYRSRLGGFYDLGQISETGRLPDSVFYAVKYHFITPNRSSIRIINVNAVSRQAFAKHPYIDYETVHHIITHREFVGRIESLDYLIKVGLLTEEKALVLGPYLSF